jgi:quercetin dioxygenase-like cupin family protein
MKIIDLKDLKAGETPGVDLKQVFELDVNGKSKFKMGTVVFPPGARVPPEGTGVHDGDEYSIVISGRIKTGSGGQENVIEAGQATLIPAGEEHWAENVGGADCHIIWVLLEP